jgi:membrane associated rhomboid family serine protease
MDVICIVDGETQPDRRFTIPPDDLFVIGQACLKYRGPTRRNPPLIKLHVLEVGPGATDPERRDSLRPYDGAVSPDGVVLSAWAIDTTSKSVWSSASTQAEFLSTRAIENVMAMPHATAADVASSIEFWRVAQASGRATPWLTYLLVVVLIAVFACQLMFATDLHALDPSVRDLASAGGLNLNLVKAGQWFRILSAPFLHAGPIHLGMNVLILAIAGRILERYVGTAWFALVYLGSAVAGSLLSIVFNPPNMVSVGASGAIMGVVAAMLVCGFRFPSGPLRSRLQVLAIQVLIPSMLPIFGAVGATGMRVDYGAHLGGAMAGALIGLVILTAWPLTSPLPGLRWAATAVVSLGLVATLPALHMSWTTAGLARHLIPEADVPTTADGQRYQGAKLAEKYPRDPRARLFHAMALIGTSDLDSAERELRAGLAETEILRSAVPPAVDTLLHANLALVLRRRGQTAESRAVAEPICHSDASEQSQTRQAMTRLGLCD